MAKKDTKKRSKQASGTKDASAFDSEDGLFTQGVLPGIGDDLRALYERAKSSLDAVIEERARVEEKYRQLLEEETKALAEQELELRRQIDGLAIALGDAPASKSPREVGTRKRSKVRIKTEQLRADVDELLSHGRPMKVIDLFIALVAKGYPETASTKSRLYGAMSKWAAFGEIEKTGRGVYKIL